MHPGRPVPAGLRLPPAPEGAQPERRAGATSGRSPLRTGSKKNGPTREAPAQSGRNGSGSERNLVVQVRGSATVGGRDGGIRHRLGVGRLRRAVAVRPVG